MKQHISKWGNSVAVRIPDTVLAAAGLKIGDAVHVRAEHGRIIIKKPSTNRLTLDDLLAGIAPENIHPEIDWGRRSARKFGKSLRCLSDRIR